MRGALAASVFLVPLLASCGSPETSTWPVTSPGAEAVLRLNELHGIGRDEIANPGFAGSVELVNIGDSPVVLSDYSLRTDAVEYWLPHETLAPGAVYVAQSLEARGGWNGVFLSQSVREIALTDLNGNELDRLDIPASLSGGVLARYPNGYGRPYVYPIDRASLGALNSDIGFVRKLAAGTAFSPRDSSTNAIVTYDGYHWILGGWGNFGGDEWYSYTDVWKSPDGVHWALVNSSPPYVHYSAFVVWRGRMWAVGPTSYSSSDGVEWREERIQSPVLNRAVVLGDSLVSIYGSTVVASDDGERWRTLTDTAPWGADRVQPAIVVYEDKIWVIGGLGGTIEDIYYNDVWVSADGVSWSLVNPYADWTPRFWTSAAVYDDKIFVINGMNVTDWADDYGNTAEIWFTEDGVEWFPLESELRWSARHASFTTVDDENGVLLLAGYGHGGLERIYNDVWSLRVSIFFPKAEGDLSDLATWGKHKDGSGDSPVTFDAPDQVFVLRNRPSFEIDESWSVRGAGSRIFVGDGQQTHSVALHIQNRARPYQPLYLLANSTTIAVGCSPDVHFKHPQAALIDDSVQCVAGDTGIR